MEISLVYTLQYSTDGGNTWSAAAVNLVDTRYNLNTEVIAGTTQGKVRVVASDGVNTASNESDGLLHPGDRHLQGDGHLT